MNPRCRRRMRSVLAVAMRLGALVGVFAAVVAAVQRRVAVAREFRRDLLARLVAGTQLRRLLAGARRLGDVGGVLAVLLDLLVVGDVAFVGHGFLPRAGLRRTLAFGAATCGEGGSPYCTWQCAQKNARRCVRPRWA